MKRATDKNREAAAPEIFNGLPVLQFKTQKEFTKWLAKNHAASAGIWLRFAKKGSDLASVTYAEAVEVALCYGWIDGQARSLDAAAWLQKYTPRGPRSLWSKVNRERALQLIESGHMKPAGLAAIEAAKRNGRWEAAYDPPSRATVPDDLKAALDRDARAKAFFETLDSRNRYAILHRLQNAKKPETRARRIEQFVKMLAKKEKLYP
jgi:uncharacterized protein YdeI (YjbR/CyaY-like superfamily)